MTKFYEDFQKDDVKEKAWFVPGIYCITVNPNDAFQFPDKEGRIKKVRAHLYDILLDFKDTRFHLETELSYPNSKALPSGSNSLSNQNFKYPRVHFHGVLELFNNASVKYFLEYGLYKLAAYHVNVTEFGKLEDGEPDIAGWVNYITKQNTVMNEKTMIMKNRVQSEPRAMSIRQQLLHGIQE